MGIDRGAAFELRPLGSHVAVRDGPSPARLTHSLAGVDYGLEEHQVRGQNLQLIRRRWFSGCFGRFAADGVASLQMPDLFRLWVVPVLWYFEIGYTDAQLGWSYDFACFLARCSLAHDRVVRLPCKAGLQCLCTWNGRPNRHMVCSTRCR